jgi:hypothetical protein
MTTSDFNAIMDNLDARFAMIERIEAERPGDRSYVHELARDGREVIAVARRHEERISKEVEVIS